MWVKLVHTFCVLFSDLDLSSTSPAFIGAVGMAGLFKNGKSGPLCWDWEVSTQFAHQPAKTTVPTVVVRLSVHVHFNMGLSPRDS